jgi:hypothetical protein
MDGVRLAFVGQLEEEEEEEEVAGEERGAIS